MQPVDSPFHPHGLRRHVCEVLGPVAALFAVTFVTYAPAFRAGFVWDDDYLTAGPLIRARDGLRRIWCGFDAHDYFPVSYSAFWIQYRLWPGNAAAYHAFNILLHAVNATLLWRILHRLEVRGAWTAAAVFAVHPLNVESVAWISEQKNTLAFAFFLLSVLALRPWPSRDRSRWPVSALILFAVSLLAKPLAILWPMALFGWSGWEGRWPSRQDLWRSLPFFVFSVVFAVFTLAYYHATRSGDLPMDLGPFPARVVRAAKAVVFYVGKTLFPADLSAIYGNKAWQWPPSAYGILGAVLTFGAIAITHHGGEAIRYAVFSLSLFVLFLAPVLGLVETDFLRYAPVCDRWAYAATAALLPLLVAAGVTAFRVSCRLPKTLAVSAGALAIAALAALSFTRACVYRDSETLFLDAISKNPTAWPAYAALGNRALDRNRLDEAEAFFRTALRYAPDYWDAHNGLGVVHARRGRLHLAIPCFIRALEIRPLDPAARRNLFQAFRDRKRQPARTHPRPAPALP